MPEIVEICYFRQNLARIAIGVGIFLRRGVPRLRLGGRSEYLVGSPARRRRIYTPVASQWGLFRARPWLDIGPSRPIFTEFSKRVGR